MRTQLLAETPSNLGNDSEICKTLAWRTPQGKSSQFFVEQKELASLKCQVEGLAGVEKASDRLRRRP